MVPQCPSLVALPFGILGIGPAQQKENEGSCGPAWRPGIGGSTSGQWQLVERHAAELTSFLGGGRHASRFACLCSGPFGSFKPHHRYSAWPIYDDVQADTALLGAWCLLCD